MFRPNWDEYFFRIMSEVSSRSTCDRGRSGCVITRNNRILVTGYVGSPPGVAHCDDIGHLIKHVTPDGSTISSDHCIRTSHAEMNAICQAARTGVSIEGAMMYVTMTPCPQICAKMVAQVGLSEVRCLYKYKHSEETEELFRMSGICISYVHDEVCKYEQR